MSTSILPGIEHVVVLMFENRSFDNMLGGLYPTLTQQGLYYGLTGGEWNPNPQDGNQPVHVWQGPTAPSTQVMPYPDPGELFTDMQQQITGQPGPGPETMMGFVANYLLQPPSKDGYQPVAQDIMQYYAPGPGGNIPITTALANAFAVSDLWFASGPVQTLANRIFAHCATPSAYQQNGQWYAVLDNTDITDRHLDPDGTVTDMPVFQLLDKAAANPDWPWPDRLPWKVNYNDWPLSALVKYVDDNWAVFEDGRVYRYDDSDGGFAADVAAGTLPTYSFIEPRYTDLFDGPPPNSNHPGGSTPSGDPPPISVYDGEILLKEVFTTLYNGPDALFAKTLFIVIYDEHGGLYDHMPPPAATSPFPPDFVTGFDYSMYGVRVPAILINPAIAKQTIWRPPGGGPPFDHTSLISTLCAQFGLAGPLTPRDAGAPTLEGLIPAQGERNDFAPADLPALAASDAAPVSARPSAASDAQPGSLAAVIAQAAASPRNQARVRTS